MSSRGSLAVVAAVLLLGSTSAAFGRAAESQRNYATGTTTVVAWWRVAVTAHHLLIAGVTYTGGTNTTITPPAGWLPIDPVNYRSDNGTTLGTAVYYIPDCPAKALHTTETFTFTAGTVATLQLTEVAGIVAASPVDSLNIALGSGNANSVTLTGSTASDDTSEYGFVLVASTAQTASFGNGTNGFARTSSYLYNTLTQATNLDAGASHRTNTESTLMTSAAGAALSTKITLPTANYSAVMVAFKVQALYWIGVGPYPARPVNPAVPNPNTCYGYFDDDACWSSISGTVGGTWSGTASPGANDVVIFDWSGSGNCTMNPWTPGTEQIYSLEVDPAYTGTITKVAGDLQLQKHVVLQGGTFTGSAGVTLRTDQVTAGTYAGDLDVDGATLNGNGMAISVRALYVESGTLNVGSGAFAATSIATLTGGTISFGGAASITSTFTNTGAVVTAGAGTTSFGNAFTMTGGSLTAGTGPVTFTGAISLNTISTLNLATASSDSFGSSISVLTGSSMTLGSAAPVSLPSTLLVRSFTGTTFSSFSAGGGTITIAGTTTVDQGASFNANNGTVNFTGALALGAAATTGTFNAQSATISFNNATVAAGNSVRLQGVGTAFNGGTAHVTFGNNAIAGSNALNISGGSVDLSTATPTFNPMGGAGNVVLSASTSLTLGATAVTFPGTVAVAGTLTGGTGAVSIAGAVTNTAGALNLASPTGLTISTGLAVSSTGVTTLGAQTVTFPNLAVSGGTFHAGTSSMTVTNAFASSGGVTDMASATGLTFTTGVTLTGGAVTFGGQTVTIPALSGSAGTLNGGTSVLTVGTTMLTGATVSLVATTMGPTFTGAISISTGTLTLGTGTAAVQSTVTMLGGTFNAGTGTTNLQSSLTMSGGTFNASSAHLNVSGPVAMTGGTLNGNTSVTTFSGSVSVAGTTALVGGIINGSTASITFAGPVSLGGSSGTLGTINGSTGTMSFEFPTVPMTAPDSLLVQGAGNLTMPNTTPANTTVTFGKNCAAGTNAINLVAGSVNLRAAAAPTFMAGNVTIASGASLTMGNTATSFSPAPATMTIAGTFIGGSGALTFPGPTTMSGTFMTGSGARTFSSTLDVTGTFTAGAGAHTFSGAVTNNAGAFNLSAAGSPIVFGSSLSIGGGTTSIGAQASVTISSLSMTSGSFNVGNAVLGVTNDTNITGGLATLSNTNRLVTFGGALNVGPGRLTAGAAAGGNSDAVTVTGTTTVNAGGIIDAGASLLFHFNGPVVLGSTTPGTFNANSGTTTFAAAFTLQDGATFNGNTGSGSFSAAPTLTSGTFTVGDAGTAGIWTLTQSTTFSSGVTLAFPTNKGVLRLANTKTLTLNGPVTSNVGTASTLPKIDCNGCANGITVAFGATSTLNLNGLEFDNSVAGGVSIASGATYTLLKRLKFVSNKGGAGSTHLAITLGTAFLRVPGCSFDSTATTNVTLNGTAGQPNGARAIFEFQSSGVNGTGAGESRDADGDNSPSDPNPDNNLGENLGAPYYGSVVEWAGAVETDTSGTAVGYPTAAFDWNTFQWYGVYVAFKDTSSGTNDVLWLRNEDGTPGYSYPVPQTSGDIVGTPWWDSVNEVTLGTDVNGDGDQTDTDVRIVYIGTSGGHIIKLIDSGASLAPPASGPWATDFTSAGVATITSPLIEDGTNVYFGGTNGSAATSIFAVQIVAGGGGEKTLARTVGSVSAVTATPSWKVYAGATYVFLGSTATSGQAYVYRVNMTAGSVQASFSGATATINDSVRLINNRAYAVTDGGTMHVLDASNFGTGAFTNLAGFPYQSAAASPIKAAAYVDYSTGNAYFGDNSGKLYIVTSAGANLANYPYTISGTPQLSSSPVYLPGTGVVAVGASDGNVYFVDRRNVSSAPNMFKRFFVTNAGVISSVGYDVNTARYMVSSSDGKLTFINAADVPDPTNTVE